MPLPPNYLPRAGDVLLLHATVTYDVARDDKEDGDLHVFVRPIGYYQDCRVSLPSVVGIARRKWEIGDRVIYREGKAGTVLATDDDDVWIKLDGPGGTKVSALANSIEAEKPAVDEPALVEPPPPAHAD